MKSLHGHRRFGWLMVLPALITLLVVGIVPFIYAIFLAVHKFSPNPAIAPRFDALGNLWALFRDPQFTGALRTTGIMLVVSVLLNMTLGLGLALALTRINRFRRALVSLILIPSALAPIVVGVTWWMMFSPRYGPVNGILEQWFQIPGIEWTIRMPSALIAIVVGIVWQTMPVTAMILFGGLLSISDSLIEAAQLDGANGGQILRHVQIPLLRPYFLIAGLLTFISTALAYEIPFFTTEGGPGNETVTVGIYLYKLAFNFGDYGRASMMSLLIVIALAILANLYFWAVSDKRSPPKRA
jgi:multiple sugar transport system permease protein